MTSGRTQTIHVGLSCLHMWVSSIFIALASSKTSMICRFMFSNRAKMCLFFTAGFTTLFCTLSNVDHFD